MINKPPPVKGLNIRSLIIIPIKGRGFINRKSVRMVLPPSLKAPDQRPANVQASKSLKPFIFILRVFISVGY